ncbi:MAG: hypothetical protein LC125_00380 [Burkholderiales bacterium]|nr:hypothetical protein [Burkholderiales bacterium]
MTGILVTMRAFCGSGAPRFVRCDKSRTRAANPSGGFKSICAAPKDPA